MNFLLLGSGGREHALAWKISQSPLCDQLYIAPGNAGTAGNGTNLDIAVTDFEKIKEACLQHRINMVIPGPEVPLVKGIADFFKQDLELEHIQVIGPCRSGAQLEGSKAFAKQFMHDNRIPTAGYQEFTTDDFEDGKKYIEQHPLPVVLKADGLAAGKGVVICETHDEALKVFEQMIKEEKFGEAGHRVVVEEFLEGVELSVFVLTDGKDYLILPEAKDYKRIGEGDTGLNTGGMGAVSPVPYINNPFMKKIENRIIEPTVKGIQKDGLDYKGFIFFGLIKVNDDPYVIEYNCRMGDPEAEVVLPRIQNDLVTLFQSVGEGTLSEQTIQTDQRFAATVVLVSGGYPGDYEKGKVIHNLTQSLAENILIFHAGTANKNGEIVTNGGRVLALTSLSGTLQQAVHHSNKVAEKIEFEGKYYRKDIGWEFI